VLATHTASAIFDLSKEAYVDNSAYTFERANVNLFEEEGDSITTTFTPQDGLKYRVLVVTDQEIVEEMELVVTDEGGKELGRVKTDDDGRATLDLESEGAPWKVTRTATTMPGGYGYATLMVMREE
jgi:hypothetical protein